MCIRDRDCGQESFNVLNPLCFFLPIVRLSDVLSVGGCSQGPVSYTHLDVYKRQAKDRDNYKRYYEYFQEMDKQKSGE